MKIHAHAKINLSLRILGKRSDGFHEIKTLMAPMEFADELDYQPNDDPLSLSCSDATLPIDKTNLIYQAAQAFQSATGIQPRGKFHLIKNIPFGAGLGGGSSNAAATLKILNTHYQQNLSKVELEKIAATLGSDVPFFIEETSAVCSGRGEIIAPLTIPLPSWSIALFKPSFDVATAEAYAMWSPAAEKAQMQEIDSIMLTNDFEPVVFKKYLLLPVLKAWLTKQPECRACGMSGSGSTFFAVLQPRQDVQDLFKRARQQFGKSLWTKETQIHVPPKN